MSWPGSSCVHVRVGMCMCARVCTRWQHMLAAHVEARGGQCCLPSLFPTLFFQAGSLTECGALMGCLANPCNSPGSAIHAGCVLGLDPGVLCTLGRHAVT